MPLYSVEHGVSLFREGRIVSAISVLQAAHGENPDAAAPLSQLANALLSIGRADEAAECAYEAHRRRPEAAALQSNFLQTLLYAPGQSAESVADLHRQWGERYGRRVAGEGRRVAGRRIRVGYVSTNFCGGPDAFFLAPVIQYHDRAMFDVYCYANNGHEDRRTEEFRGRAQGWRRITGMGAAEIAALVREDGIDLLVDCNGHFGNSPLRAFCEQPAPVQVCFPIYPATTGLPTVQYRVTDGIADPYPEADGLHAEKLVRLPEVFTCFGPFEGSPEVSELPARRNGFVTFGCFNRLHKVNDLVIETFARVMEGVAGSQLLLHHAYPGLRTTPEELSAYVRGRFEKYGIDGGRVRFAGACPLQEHLALYGEVDLSLDTFPYAGMTTTCDSLWMGVPVVTLAGRGHVSRVGVSRMTTLEVEDWIAGDLEEYVRIGRAKAGDLDGLAELRRGLRERMRGSAMVDGARYVRHLEAAYLEMLRAAGLLG